MTGLAYPKVQQDHFLLPAILRLGACNWRSLLSMVEDEVGARYTIYELMHLWIDCLADLSMDVRGTVDYPNRVLLKAIAWAQAPLQLYQVGADGVFWRWVTEAQKRVDHTMLVGRTANGNRHFRHGDLRGNLLWDPSPTVVVTHELSLIYYHAQRS
jgi:hypothetical protein